MSERPEGKTRAAGKRRPGRPSKLTPEVEARILNAIRCGAPNDVACAAGGIGERTFYTWEEKGRLKPNSEYGQFQRKLTRARQEGIATRLAIVMKAATKDWRAAAWLLERDLPEAFSLKFKIEHSVAEPTLADVLCRLREDRMQPKLLKEAETC